MLNFSFENRLYMEKLNHQAIHMDQGITYSPEYRATRKVRNYPSRIAQISRAIHLNELDASDNSSNLIFSPILSGLGERWQNFGEDQNDNTLCLILSREMMVKKGFRQNEINELKENIKNNDNHITKVLETSQTRWNEAIKTDENSKTFLLLDDATFNYTSEFAQNIGTLLNNRKIVVKNNIQSCFVGFEYFAAGLVEEGEDHLRNLINYLKLNKINKVITLTGQSQYVLTTLCEALNIDHNIEVVSILDIVENVETRKSYVYGGSFYTRLLKKSDRLNEIAKNNSEEIVKNSWEFTPLLVSDNRLNKVTMWEMPLCAEYENSFGNKELERKIYNITLKDMSKIDYKNIVVFDPYVYNYLKNNNYNMKKVQYFASVAN